MITRLSAAVLGAVLIGVVGFANPVSAHVTVDPEEAVQGGYARVVFRVPNERDNASTTKVEIHLPEAQPVAGVRTMPVPGWKVAVKDRKLDQPIEQHGQQIDTVVSTLTWTPTAKANAIGPDEFVEFPVSLGPLPEAPTMVFKALQTYDNGEVVRWIEEPAAGGEEPEHPAPVLALAKAPAEDPGGTPTQVGNAREPAGEARDEEAPAGTPLWLGIAGLAAGLVALAFALIAYGRTRTESSVLDEEDEEPADESAALEDASVDDTDLDDDARLDEDAPEQIRPPRPPTP